MKLDNETQKKTGKLTAAIGATGVLAAVLAMNGAEAKAAPVDASIQEIVADAIIPLPGDRGTCGDYNI